MIRCPPGHKHAVVGRESMSRPDVFVIDRARWKAAAVNKTYPTGSPQLVIEVFSPANDTPGFREEAGHLYCDGAAAVWVVRPKSQMIEVHDR